MPADLRLRSRTAAGNGAVRRDGDPCPCQWWGGHGALVDESNLTLTRAAEVPCIKLKIKLSRFRPSLADNLGTAPAHLCSHRHSASPHYSKPEGTSSRRSHHLPLSAQGWCLLVCGDAEGNGKSHVRHCALRLYHFELVICGVVFLSLHASDQTLRASRVPE